MQNLINYVFGVAAKSNIEKRKVGCILVNSVGSIVAEGYNTEHVHAEVNALENLYGLGSSMMPVTAYVTHAPCPDCAKRLLNAGITEVKVVEGFMKFDGDKVRLDLVPASAITALGEVLTYGARKYKPNNWRNVEDLERYKAAMLRHIVAYQAGETHDEESGMPHLWHAMTNIAFLIELDAFSGSKN